MQLPKFITKEKGDYGEKLIALYLAQKGHTVIAKKFKTFYGEIDLITEQKLFYKETQNKEHKPAGQQELNSHLLTFYEIKFTKTNPFLKWKNSQKYRFIKAVKIFLTKNPQYLNYKFAMQLVWLNKINSTKIKIVKYKNIELNYD